MAATRGSPDAQAELNRMMAERFTTFVFNEPLPVSKCGRCAAVFYLQGSPSTSTASSSGRPFAAAVAPQRAEGSVLLTSLSDLAKLSQRRGCSAYRAHGRCGATVREEKRVQGDGDAHARSAARTSLPAPPL